MAGGRARWAKRSLGQSGASSKLAEEELLKPAPNLKDVRRYIADAQREQAAAMATLELAPSAVPIGFVIDEDNEDNLPYEPL